MRRCDAVPFLPELFCKACFSLLLLPNFAVAQTDGPTPFFAEGFDDEQLHQRGWYDGNRFTISTQEPFSGTGSVEFSWKERTTTPSSTSVMRRLFQPSESVYVRFRIRFSDGWGWSGRPYHPHLMHFMTTENDKYRGPASSHLTLYIEPWEGKLRLAAQDIQNQNQPHGLTQGPLRGGYNGTMYDSAERVFTDAKWHIVEAEFQLNTLDLANDRPQANGLARGWVDGALVVDRQDLVFRSTDFPHMLFNQYLLSPYFGPGLLPHAQTLWIDDLVVADRRPND